MCGKKLQAKKKSEPSLSFTTKFASLWKKLSKFLLEPGTFEGLVWLLAPNWHILLDARHNQGSKISTPQDSHHINFDPSFINNEIPLFVLSLS